MRSNKVQRHKKDEHDAQNVINRWARASPSGVTHKFVQWFGDLIGGHFGLFPYCVEWTVLEFELNSLTIIVRTTLLTLTTNPASHKFKRNLKKVKKNQITNTSVREAHAMRGGAEEDK